MRAPALPAIWLLRWRVWVPALVFFLLSLGILLVYRFVYAGRVDVLEQRIHRQQAELDSVEAERRDLEGRRQQAALNRERLAELYEKRFSTAQERLTQMIAEVKALVRRSGLQPSTITYPEQSFTEYGLMKKQVIFAVQGSYLNLRQLINQLELSEEFLTLEEVALVEENAGGLKINLRISTLFQDEGRPQPQPLSAPAARARARGLRPPGRETNP